MGFDRREAAWASLHGLALGDALGSQFFVPENLAAYASREVPPGRWRWTDDTEMACGIWSVLAEAGHVDQDLLARTFAERHDFMRGYGPSTNRLLRLVREGGDWRELAREPFEGQGSWGNGAAGGDIDTNCAIVGGIVAARAGFSALPARWLPNLEPLPVTR